MRRSPESENPYILGDIRTLAVALQIMRAMYPILEEAYPHKYSSDEMLLEAEEEIREVFRNLVREAKQEGISPTAIATTVLKGKLIAETGLMLHFKTRAPFYELEKMAKEYILFEKEEEFDYTPLKEKLQCLGYEIEKKKIPDIWIVRVSQENQPELYRHWDLIFDSPVNSMPTAETSWTIYINPEKIPKNLIPFVEAHEFVEVVELFNGAGRHVAEQQAILYEYLYAQDENLLGRVHQFGVEALRKGLEREGLPEKIIEFGQWKLEIREKTFKQLTTG